MGDVGTFVTLLRNGRNGGRCYLLTLLYYVIGDAGSFVSLFPLAFSLAQLRPLSYIAAGGDSALFTATYIRLGSNNTLYRIIEFAFGVIKAFLLDFIMEFLGIGDVGTFVTLLDDIFQILSVIGDVGAL